MRILQIIYSLSSGGAERFVTDLNNELVKIDGCEVNLLILKSDRTEKNIFYKGELSDKVKFESLGIDHIDFTIFLRLYKYIRNYKPDIVHIHLSPIILFCSFAILCMRSTIFIETLHNEVSKINNSNKLYYYFKKIIYNFKNVRVCAISDKNAAEFKRIYGLSCDALIYNGRKKLESSIKGSLVEKEIDSYKQNSETIVVTHIARCAPQKNQDLLVDSFNKILRDQHNVILLIIGSGFDSDMGKKLKAKAEKGIFFLGEKHNVQDYLLCSDAFCLSSLYEGMPITLIEALAYGCVPLSTPVSGVTDLIRNGENGFVSADFTLHSFVQMLNNFIVHRNEIDRQKLIDLYHEKLSIEACAQSYYKFYNTCLNA